MAVNDMRTFLLKDVGLAATWLVTAVFTGTVTLACSSDPASDDKSTSAGPTSNNTTTGTSGAPTTTTSGAGPTTSGAGPTTSGAGPTTSGAGPTTAGQNTTTAGGPTTGANNNTTTGAGGASTTAGTTGVVGSCGLTVDSYELSPAISTVGIVTWSAAGVTGAEIKFGPADAPDFTMSAPVDLAEPNYRTLLLGMKSDSDYKFQIVATADGAPCTSDVLTLTTGPVPNDVSIITRDVKQEAKVAPGFKVTVQYSRGGYAFIIDGDGDPVWWAPALPANTPEPSGVRMDYEGKAIWTVTGNPSASGTGRIRRTSMDGTDVKDLEGSYDAHHDLAPLPGGSVAALIHSGDNCASIIEVHPDMSVTDLVPDVSTIYTPVMQCHPNSILYHPEDESFTVSDRNPNLYVKISKTGEVQWQFGGAGPALQGAPHIEETWQVNHGHQLLPNGNFLFFNNNGNGGGLGASPVHEFVLDVDAGTAEEVWSYTSTQSSVALGDVQRLSNGNTLITYSTSSAVHEVDPDGGVVQTLQNSDPLGYLMHRDSLYGPPPK